MNKAKKYFYITLGFIALGLGLIGVILPILPTTPFLLLAMFFFTKSSKRAKIWFEGTKLYQNHLDSFVQRRAMTLKTKICILSLASFMLAFPLFLTDLWWLRVFIIGLYIFKYYYFLFKIKTIKLEHI